MVQVGWINQFRQDMALRGGQLYHTESTYNMVNTADKVLAKMKWLPIVSA